MKRLRAVGLGLLLALAAVSVTTRASEKSLFPYRVELNNPSTLMGNGGGNSHVFCDEKVGVLIYELRRSHGSSEFAAVRGLASCKASGEKVTFPYQFGNDKVFCDAKAGVLIYDFTGPWHAQFVVVPAPDVCS